MTHWKQSTRKRWPRRNAQEGKREEELATAAAAIEGFDFLRGQGAFLGGDQHVGHGVSVSCGRVLRVLNHIVGVTGGGQASSRQRCGPPLSGCGKNAESFRGLEEGDGLDSGYVEAFADRKSVV